MLTSTRHGDVMVLTTVPSMPIAIVERPVAPSVVQFIEATWNPPLHGDAALYSAALLHGGLPGSPSLHPHFAGSSAVVTPGILKTCTCEGRSVSLAPPETQEVLSLLHGQRLQLGPAGPKGCLSGPQVPRGSAGQPVLHLLTGVFLHLSGSSGSCRSGWLEVPAAARQAVSHGAFEGTVVVAVVAVVVESVAAPAGVVVMVRWRRRR